MNTMEERAPTPPDFLAKVWECEGDGETIMRLYAAALRAVEARALAAEARAERAEAALRPFAKRCAEVVRPDDEDRSGVTVHVIHLRAARAYFAALTPTGE